MHAYMLMNTVIREVRFTAAPQPHTHHISSTYSTRTSMAPSIDHNSTTLTHSLPHATAAILPPSKAIEVNRLPASEDLLALIALAEWASLLMGLVHPHWLWVLLSNERTAELMPHHGARYAALNAPLSTLSSAFAGSLTLSCLGKLHQGVLCLERELLLSPAAVLPPLCTPSFCCCILLLFLLFF